MARRPAAPTQPERPVLTVQQKRRGIARLRQRIDELEAYDPQTLQKRFNDPRLTALETAIDEALSSVFGHGTIEYRRYQRATSLDHGSVTMRPVLNGGRYDDTPEARQYVAEGRQEAIALLRRAVSSLEEEIEDQEAPQTADYQAVQSRDPSKVFIVHGHDEGPREAVRSFLLRLGFEPIVLHDQPNKGRTIITKFREEAGDAGFAVVLMTPDDVGGVPGLAGQILRPRARQNVVFELGFFIGELGPERVAALVKGNVERPSDYDGVVYIDLDDGGAWKMILARELRAAGLSFDANKVFG